MLLLGSAPTPPPHFRLPSMVCRADGISKVFWCVSHTAGYVGFLYPKTFVLLTTGFLASVYWPISRQV